MSAARIAAYRQTAEIFLRDSAFMEIRLIGATGTKSGVFSDADAAAAAVAKVDGTINVYVIANPIRSDWIPTSMGAFKRPAKGECIADDDIGRRAFFLIDVDNSTKGKESATKDEVESALRVRESVNRYLKSLGWPDPMEGFSGNGGWSVFRTDLPNDEEMKALYRNALNALAFRFNTEAAVIDLSAATAARVVPFFGTWKRKGTNTPERPHRRSKITSLGSSELVSLEQLQQLAAMKPKSEETAPRDATGKGFQKLEEILDAAGVQHTTGNEVAGITWYGISAADGNCPFGDSSGNGGKCGVGQDKSGKLYGHCFAADHPWSEWKEQLGLAPFFNGASPDDGLPIIMLGDELSVTTSKFWDALIAQNDPPKLFRFGTTLVEVLV